MNKKHIGTPHFSGGVLYTENIKCFKRVGYNVYIMREAAFLLLVID